MSEREVPAGCAPYDEELSAWLDGESGAAGVGEHVAGCARCAARAAELRAVDASLRTLAATPGVAEAERLARVHARVLAEGAPAASAPSLASTSAKVAPPRRRRLPAALTAAAAAAAIVAAFALPRLFEQPAGTPIAAAPVAPAAPMEERVPEVGRIAQRAPALGHGEFGASSDEGAAAPQAAAAKVAPAPAAEGDELDLALALDELGDVAPADLALVERLDAVERMGRELR